MSEASEFEISRKGHSKGKEKVEDDFDSGTLVDDFETDNLSLNSATLADGEAPKKVMYMNGDFNGDLKPFKHSKDDSDELLQTQISQLQYNNHRVALNRAINTTVQILTDLSKENNSRGVHFPMENNTGNDELNDVKSLLALKRRNTSSSLLTSADIKEPELSSKFKVLNLDLKRTGTGGDLLSTLDEKAIAKLLDEKVQSTVKHLIALRKRIDDTTSKVFVTGDLNAGKSTFCNALLRRQLLPEDQQPCTSVFCEVIDCRENNGIEEVHAVYIGKTYDSKNEGSYKIFQLDDLEDLVGEYDKYSILKVYVNDNRTVDRSLLKNGVIDINLIDAPGLNLDSYQTTEVFSRQEEIDLVVFVVSAENHFTLSAREFISAAAKERQFIFIVVNRFDTIKNKDRCVKRILNQVQALSPETHKDARDFVHFVSSSDVVGSSGGGGGGGGGGDGDDDGDPNNDGNDNINNSSDPNFDHLESSLRKFVLEKRALSKFAPAKNFLLKTLGDVEDLASYNKKLYDEQEAKLTEELNNLVPIFEKQVKDNDVTSKAILDFIESLSDDVYEFSKNRIGNTINELDTSIVDVKFHGIYSIYEYAKEIQKAMIKSILKSVELSESYAKKKTVAGVTHIKALGQKSLGNDTFLKDKIFREDFMFQRKRHLISKNLNEDVSMLDFFDPSIDGILNTIGLRSLPFSVTDISNFKFNYTNALSLVFLGSSTKFLVTLRALVYLSSSNLFHKLVTSGWFVKAILAGAVGVSAFFFIKDIPNAFKRKFAKKLKFQINEIDYATSNGLRIAKECRVVLQYPAKEVNKKFDSLIGSNYTKKQSLVKDLKSFDISVTFYGRLAKRARDQKKLVDSFDLETIYRVD